MEQTEHFSQYIFNEAPEKKLETGEAITGRSKCLYIHCLYEIPRENVGYIGSVFTYSCNRPAFGLSKCLIVCECVVVSVCDEIAVWHCKCLQYATVYLEYDMVFTVWYWVYSLVLCLQYDIVFTVWYYVLTV